MKLNFDFYYFCIFCFPFRILILFVYPQFLRAKRNPFFFISIRYFDITRICWTSFAYRYGYLFKNNNGGYWIRSEFLALDIGWRSIVIKVVLQLIASVVDWSFHRYANVVDVDHTKVNFVFESETYFQIYCNEF